MNIGEAIRDLRKKRNMSQIELAKKSKTTQASLSMIENGQSRPGDGLLHDICNALEVPPAVLYIMSLERSDFGRYCTDREWSLVGPAAKFMLLELCRGYGV